MHALTTPVGTRGPGLLAGTPVALLAVLALLAVVAVTAPLPPAVSRAVGVAAGHGALLATALAWGASGRSARRERPGAPVVAVLLLLAGALAAAAAPWGAFAYVAVPLWLVWLGRRTPAPPLGLGGRAPAAMLAAGALVGLLLGAHVLLAATLTLGYRVRLGALGDQLRWIAYDVGANVPAAECFFRGALFERVERRWSFAAAAVVSTAAYVARYLLDPLLPWTLELMAGAVFYLAVLGFATCWLFARSGSLGPGFTASAIFFSAYRLLGWA